VITDWLAGRASAAPGGGGASGAPAQAAQGAGAGGGGAWGSVDPGQGGSGWGDWSGWRLPAVGLTAGTFKYVLLRVREAGGGGRARLVVRGHAHAAYHNHVLQAAKAEASAVDPGLEVEVLGGGRMEVEVEARRVRVYGYSAAFGPAPHEVTAALLRRWLPLAEIEWAYEGY
jgi:hypothetical protein